MVKNTDHQKRVTQKQIAHDLDLSVMTVYRAIHGTGYVSEVVKQRIFEYMKRSNYRPHRAARSLVKGAHHSIALFSTDQPRSFWADVDRGVQMVAEEIAYFGFNVRYERITQANTRAYLRAIDAALKGGVESIALVNNAEFDMRRIFTKLDSAGVPYITFNIDAPETGRCCYVGPDYIREGRIVAHHLHQVMGRSGHLIIVTGPVEPTAKAAPGSAIESERITGVRDYLLDIGGYRDHELIWRQEESAEEMAGRIAELVTRLPAGPIGLYIPHIEPSDLDRLFSRLSDVGPVVLSYFSSHTLRFLDSGKVSAVVYQDPVLQGYLATRVLEHIAETGQKPARDSFIIHQSLINRENPGVVDNMFLVRNLRL